MRLSGYCSLFSDKDDYPYKRGSAKYHAGQHEFAADVGNTNQGIYCQEEERRHKSAHPKTG